MISKLLNTTHLECKRCDERKQSDYCYLHAVFLKNILQCENWGNVNTTLIDMDGVEKDRKRLCLD